MHLTLCINQNTPKTMSGSLCLIFLCPKLPIKWRTAPFIFVSIYQRLHAPEISSFLNVLTPYIVVCMIIIYNMLYLAPNAPNVTGFSNVLSADAQIKKPTWSLSLLQPLCKLETNQVGVYKLPNAPGISRYNTMSDACFLLLSSPDL